MLYRVRAKIIEQRLGRFYEKLTDGTIDNQLPDGKEIVASMKRATITTSGVVEWFKTCFGQHLYNMNVKLNMILIFMKLILNLSKILEKLKGNHFGLIWNQ